MYVCLHICQFIKLDTPESCDDQAMSRLHGEPLKPNALYKCLHN